MKVRSAEKPENLVYELCPTVFVLFSCGLTFIDLTILLRYGRGCAYFTDNTRGGVGLDNLNVK